MKGKGGSHYGLLADQPFPFLNGRKKALSCAFELYFFELCLKVGGVRWQDKIYADVWGISSEIGVKNPGNNILPEIRVLAYTATLVKF